MSSLSISKIAKKESSKSAKLNKKRRDDVVLSSGKFTKKDPQELELTGLYITRDECSKLSKPVTETIGVSTQQATKVDSQCLDKNVNSDNLRTSEVGGHHDLNYGKNQNGRQPTRETPSGRKLDDEKISRQSLSTPKTNGDCDSSSTSISARKDSSKTINNNTEDSKLNERLPVDTGNRQDDPDSKGTSGNRPVLPRGRRRSSVYSVDLITGDGKMSQDSPPPPEVTYDVSDDVIDALNSVTFAADVDGPGSSSETSSQTGSMTSSNRDGGDVTNLWMEDHRPDKPVTRVESDESNIKKKKVFKNPIKMLKKTLSQGEITPPFNLPEPDLKSVTIDSLPQQFVTKFLGRKRCDGLQGLDYIRGPIDKMVREVTGGSAETKDRPLVQLTVWPKGLQASLHPKTRNRDFDPFYLPIDFISFCAEHGSYQKIVGVISVTQMGPKTTKTECHAYICHSALEARKLTVSMATAFRMYAEKLNGSQVKFKVDLRSKEEQGRRRKSNDKEFEA